MPFHFEWHSILSNIQIWVIFQFEWHLKFSVIHIWVTLQFEWYSVNMMYLTVEAKCWIVYAAFVLPARHVCDTQPVRSCLNLCDQSGTNSCGGRNCAPSCTNVYVLNKEIQASTTFQFEWHSYLSDILIWVTFQFGWYSNLSDILIWVTFQFEWHSKFSDIQIRVTFQFEWHSNLSDIPIWVTFHFDCHSILSNIIF